MAYQLHFRVCDLSSSGQVGVNTLRCHTSNIARKRFLGVQIRNLGYRFGNNGVVNPGHVVGSRVPKDLAHSVQIRGIHGLCSQCGVLRQGRRARLLHQKNQHGQGEGRSSKLARQTRNLAHQAFERRGHPGMQSGRASDVYESAHEYGQIKGKR